MEIPLEKRCDPEVGRIAPNARKELTCLPRRGRERPYLEIIQNLKHPDAIHSGRVGASEGRSDEFSTPKSVSSGAIYYGHAVRRANNIAGLTL